MVVATLEDVRRMAAHIDMREPMALRDKALLALAFHTGLRVSELAALTVEMVAHQGVPRETLFVSSAIAKWHKSRSIPLNAVARHTIAAMLHFNRKRGFETAPTSPLFQNRFHRPLAVRDIQRMIAELRERAGLDTPVTCHSLRHGFATSIAQRGANSIVLQSLMGHRSVNTTAIYYKPTADDKRQAVNLLAPPRS